MRSAPILFGKPMSFHRLDSVTHWTRFWKGIRIQMRHWPTPEYPERHRWTLAIGGTLISIGDSATRPLALNAIKRRLRYLTKTIGELERGAG